MKRFFFLWVLLLSTACVSMLAPQRAAAREPAPERELVIYDNDWSVSSGGYVSESALMLLLTNPRIDVLGLTSVSGDFWRDEGVATLLRFLEIVGATQVPVHNGAVFPLVNSAARHAAWEARYGKIYWSGAWNDRTRDPKAHADDPWKVTPPREGMPTDARPAAQGAVAFLIDAVHRYPNRVTIYAEGPLTNIALAVRQDPDFARLAKRIVIQGSSAASANDDGSKPAEFNFIFDPEAADIVLTAPWNEAVLLGDVSNQTVLTPAAAARIKAIDTPAARFAVENASVGLPLWSQIGGAIIADPTIIRHAVSAIVDVSLDHGRTYGRTRSWPADAPSAPRSGQRPVTLVTRVDETRLIDAYIDSLGRSVVPSPARP